MQYVMDHVPPLEALQKFEDSLRSLSPEVYCVASSQESREIKRRAGILRSLYSAYVEDGKEE